MHLFSDEKRIWQLPNAEIIYIPKFFDLEKSNLYFETLLASIAWQQDDITVFGKTYRQPRLTALYSSINRSYTYSNIQMFPKSLTDALIEMMKEVNQFCEHEFNSILLNQYRDGTDSNGWHSDNEKELGVNPVIASLSLGEARYFHFKHKTKKNEKHKLLLEHGSLLIMKGATQHNWQHQLPKSKKIKEPRINLTFRIIKKHKE